MSVIKVSNGTCIRRLSWKSLKASRTRNVIAMLAIALTTVLFTSLFTIALSINEGLQQSKFRQAGGWSHGGFKYLTEEQFYELRDDPLIEEWGLRRFLGMPTDIPFNKSHVEIGYSDAKQAHWMFCVPVEGRLPQENTNEAATDLRVLELLGVEPELGNEFTMTFYVDGHETTQTFTLCGWWEYDEAIVANHVLVPESRVNAVLEEVGVTPGQAEDGMTGSWNMDVMLKSGARRIGQDLDQILASHGYQSESMELGDNFIRTGINWGYTGAQLSENLDPATVLAIAAMVLLIIFTGYLIIYNVFQISVTNDIRFYGLLKTIGTTPRQLRRIIRQQALLLCVVGIPIGMMLGWGIGSKLTPVIAAQLNGVVAVTSVSPVIFLVSALFALVTVLISCRRPGRLAGRVSPVEAVRYTEGNAIRKKARGASGSVSLHSMALANLGRSRGKTALTITSLALAVVLLTVTVIFTRSFDMDKYIANFTASDFIVADAGQFQTGGESYNRDMALPSLWWRTFPPRAASQREDGSMAKPPPWRNLSRRTITAPSRASGTRRNSWTARSISWTAMRRGCWQIAPSSTAWSPSPWITCAFWTEICPNSMSRAGATWPPCTATTTTANPKWTATGPVWGTLSPCGTWKNTNTMTLIPARSIPRIWISAK